MRKILVLGTGGTISCKESADGLTPALSVSELVQATESGKSLPVEISAEQLFELDSTNMTSRHWEAAAKRIHERYDEFDGFVVTHGTDTMGYAAASLSCLIRNSRKPIALTGSMLPLSANGSDAPKNLRDAVMFAADERAFGVRVVFSGKIFDGRCAVKLDTSSEDSFVSVNNANVGVITCADKLRYNEMGSEKYSGETRFYERLSDDVFLVKLIPGQALSIPENARVVIIESYGNGGVPDYLMSGVQRLAEKGVYIIVATQCRFGSTDLRRYEVGHKAAERFSLLETGEMTVEYAVARARWALEYSKDFDGFCEMFYEENGKQR